jgi:hypothetical protein
MGKTKGLTANNYVAYVTERATAEQLERIKGQLGEAARALLFETPILAMSYVDYGAVIELLLAADKVMGKGDLELLRDASRQNQRKNLGGIYRTLVSLASPDFVIERASKLWERYHDTGRLSAEKYGTHAVKLTLRDYPGIPMHHGPEIEGAFEELINLTGAKKESIIHTQCVNLGDPVCAWDIKWR